MPWKETDVTDQRLQFIAHLRAGDLSMTALCREFGISRPTGYKYQDRYRADGVDGLKDRSRAPHTSPQATPEALVTQIVALKAQHPTWGPRKLRAYLDQHAPDQPWPAPSTIGALLAARGLTQPRRARPQAPRPSFPLTPGETPNAVWAMDFKGWFPTDDGVPCYPFVLLDHASRFLLRCQAVRTPDTASVQPLLLGAFCEYGLPTVLRSDNGTPFGSTGLGGLSHLAVWCLRLGIRPEYCPPGCPQQNGRLERFNRTLEADVTARPAADLAAQQRVFTAYRPVYNTERPHAALGDGVPDAVYTPSPRPYPRLGPPPFRYPDTDHVYRVRPNGCLKWRGQDLYTGLAFCGELVGLRPLTATLAALYVGPLPIALLDETHGAWLPAEVARPWLAPLRAELAATDPEAASHPPTPAASDRTLI
jgi:transposase InsO family protein